MTAPNCPECNDTGVRDSGGVQPWGEAIFVTCDCLAGSNKRPASPQPIDMILYCPACGTQHIDAPTPCNAEMCEGGCVQPEECNAWRNPPHRSHLCASCGHIWRPADVPTNGVQAIATRGKDDSETVVSCANLISLLNEVRENFTRDDDLPNDLLPRIDAALN